MRLPLTVKMYEASPGDLCRYVLFILEITLLFVILLGSAFVLVGYCVRETAE